MARTETDSVLIKKKLEQMLPNMQFSVTRDSFAGGHSVSIGIKGGNIQPYTNPENHTTRYTINEFHYRDDSELTPEIKEIISKVMDIAFSINNSFSARRSSSYLHLYLGVSTKTKSEPYNYIPSKSKTTNIPSGSTTTSRGELRKECAGWKIYKKTLPTGSIVYNAVKDKETAPNKGDWATIKSEVYIETGFKWGRFGSFDKWGEITESRGEVGVLGNLCEILNKYYGSTTPAPMPSTTPTPNEPQEPFKINESYKSLPANPKLEYCRITSAEGLIGYADTFPKTFQSFTALTKYIADNIGEVPTQGYDKHNVDWKWNFQNETHAERWDVSEREANPNKYPNLYASEILQKMCYYAWAKKGDSDEELAKTDEYFSNVIGKVGLEINTDQFNTMLTGFLTYYKEDKERFAYNTPESRLNRFKQAYPKIIAEFEEQPINKAQLTKAIAGLEILAAKGNEKAKKAIIGLQYLLNK